MIYKVNYSGYQLIEADSEEEASEKFDYNDFEYDEVRIENIIQTHDCDDFLM